MWNSFSLCAALLISILVSEGRAQDDTVSPDLHQEQYGDDTNSRYKFETTNTASYHYTPQTNTEYHNDTNDHFFTSSTKSASVQPTHVFTYSGLYLYNASVRGDLVSINKALRAGIDPGWGNTDKDNSTPMHAAAQYNHPEIVSALINARADKDIQNDWGATALFYASGVGSIDAATVLIAHGASVDIPSFYFGTALHFAALLNQSAIVNLLLNAGANKDSRDDGEFSLHRGATPLYYASRYGIINTAALLIDHGANLDIQDEEGFTALHKAAENSHPAIVSALVNAGADKDLRDNKKGGTPLYYATQHPNIEATTVLIESGANLDIPENNGVTALQMAAWTNNVHVVNALLNAGADKNSQDNIGRTPLYTASQTFLIDTVNLLLSANVDVNIPSNNPRYEGTTALHIAANFDNLEVVKALLCNGADANKLDDDGMTPVALAQINGNQQVADFIISFADQSIPATTYSGLYLYNSSARGDLTSVYETLAAGINPNWGNPFINNSTPLHAAAQFNHPEIVDALINAGADKDIQNDWGSTPLFYASGAGSISTATVLIAHGANVNISSFYFGTPLHFAAFSNQSAIANLLLKAGADKDRRDDGEFGRHRGATPLYYASRYNSIDVATLLIAHGASVDIPASVNDGLVRGKFPRWGSSRIYSTPLHVASMFSEPAIVSALVDAGADKDRLDDGNNTPLSYATRRKNLDAANVLIARGASLDIPDNEYTGDTLLHRASRSNKAALVSALLEGGADKDIQDNYGRTPLYDASGSGSIDIVKILIDANASVNIPSNEGTIALHIAILGDHLDVVKVLLHNGADIDKEDNSGLTPLASAKLRGHNQVAAFINIFTKTNEYD